MDTNTRTYRLSELAAVRQDASGADADRKYLPTLQIPSTAGKTKHLALSWDEFERIAALLTTGAHSESDAGLREALQHIADACGLIAEDQGHSDQFRDGWGSAHAKLGAYARAALARATA